MRPDPRLVAHRGITFPRGDRPAPVENTVEALAAASDHGCAAVEFDVDTTNVQFRMNDLPLLCGVFGDISELDLPPLNRR